jgi:hypothetical protein
MIERAVDWLLASLPAILWSLLWLLWHHLIERQAERNAREFEKADPNKAAAWWRY